MARNSLQNHVFLWAVLGIRKISRDIGHGERYIEAMPIYQTQSEEETSVLAARIAASCKGGEVFLLNGPLGAGKSLFARGFIKELAGKHIDVPSPTFTILQTYETAKGTVYHFDLYRLHSPEEVIEIGWEDAVSGRNIVLAEWPERAGSFLPKKARYIRITPKGGTMREIEIDE